MGSYSTHMSFDSVPGELPYDYIPVFTDMTRVTEHALLQINNLTVQSLSRNAIWRDLLALTGYYRTFHSPSVVLQHFNEVSRERRRSTFRSHPSNEPRISTIGERCSWVDIDVVFTVCHGSLLAYCMGTISMTPDADGQWRIWMVRTWLERFENFRNPDVARPLASVGISSQKAERVGGRDFEVVIVGGGQCGLSTAGRLQALDVSYVLLEKNDQIGDNWGLKYKSLRWHTAKEYGNLPFGHTFPESDPYEMPGPRIAKGFKCWSEKHNLNIRSKTTVQSATWDEDRKIWSISASVNGLATVMTARHLVLAIGTGQAAPAYPSWATPEMIEASGYKGTVVHSLSGYTSAEMWTGKRGIVIGTANTGHDMAEDMADAGMVTTIVQRNPTFVFPAQWLQKSQDVHFNAETDPEDADRASFTYPMKIMREMANRSIWPLIKANPERFDALEKAGFLLDRYGDVYDNIYVRMGGHYVDTGASARIVHGEIKVKTALVKGLGEDGLIFEDGTAIGADLVVLATGFRHDFREDAAKIVGWNIAQQMDEFWGIDCEGEIRGNAKPAGHPNLWYIGGGMQVARFFSRFLALQIQADVLGYTLVPYI